MVPKWQERKHEDQQWGLELASYNITFEWISGVKNKATDCLS